MKSERAEIIETLIEIQKMITGEGEVSRKITGLVKRLCIKDVEEILPDKTNDLCTSGKEYNQGLLKAIEILNKTWQDYFDDEIITKNEFAPINAYHDTLMTEFNKALINDEQLLKATDDLGMAESPYYDEEYYSSINNKEVK